MEQTHKIYLKFEKKTSDLEIFPWCYVWIEK